MWRCVSGGFGILEKGGGRQDDGAGLNTMAHDSSPPVGMDLAEFDCLD